MRICESFMVFTLPQGSRHLGALHESGTGVDFEVGPDRRLWLEVKNFSPPSVPSEFHHKLDESLFAKSEDPQYYDLLARKALGTHHFLMSRNERPPSPSYIFCYCSSPGKPSIIDGAILRSAMANYPELNDVLGDAMAYGAKGAPNPDLCILDSELHCMTSATNNCSRLKQIHK